MDVGNPSNFIRILELFNNEFSALEKILTAVSITDEETEATIGRLFKDYGYTADPHGAVGYLALERYLAAHPGSRGIFLETAHPVKFPDAVERATGAKQIIPASVHNVMQGKKNSLRMKAGYALLKDYLMNGRW
jgi:threonine synthase